VESFILATMFARKPKLCTAIPVNPPSQCLQETLLEKSSNKCAKVHQHGTAEEDPSLLVVASPELANIQSCSFLLGLIIAFCIEANAWSAHAVALAMLGDDADPDTVILLYIMGGCFTTVIITLCLIRTLERLISYPPSVGDPIIMRQTQCRFVFGTLIGVCSAWVLMDLCLLGMDDDGHGSIKYSAGMLVGVMMLSLVFQHHCGNKKTPKEVTLFGSFVEANKVAPTSTSTNTHGTIDPGYRRHDEVMLSDLTLLIIV
jgi:hypothetical protein